MARHNIYVNDETEQVIAELGLARDGWSQLFTVALTAHLTTMPEAKVRRALGRVVRRETQQRVDQLLPARDA